MVVHATELQVSSAARIPGLPPDFIAQGSKSVALYFRAGESRVCSTMAGAFTQDVASYRTETDDTVTYDAPAAYRVESYNDLSHRAKVHQLQGLSGTTGDLT